MNIVVILKGKTTKNIFTKKIKRIKINWMKKKTTHEFILITEAKVIFGIILNLWNFIY